MIFIQNKTLFNNDIQLDYKKTNIFYIHKKINIVDQIVMSDKQIAHSNLRSTTADLYRHFN